jgi:lipoate-protein ligase A
VETLETHPRVLQSWRLVSTPPLSGEDNMRYDAELLKGVEEGSLPPTLRFFRFKEPTVSYGRLQKLKDIAPLVLSNWASVQRPTGGGVVFHDGDLCFSLCWHEGQGPLPARPQDQYLWIHTAILEALRNEAPLRMAACRDATPSREPFAIRTCFQNPVGYDLLLNHEKIVGGALRCARRATLYQGSLQMKNSAQQEARLRAAFETRLNPDS